MKAYDLEAHFTAPQLEKYRRWREALIANVTANEDDYMRPARYDAVLSMLFPDMAQQIKKGYGRLPDVA